MPKQNKFIFFKNKGSHPNLGELSIGGEAIERIGENCREKSFKFLGHHLDETLAWSHHLNHIYKKLVSANFALSRSKKFLPTFILKSIYQSLFESHLHFGSIVWGCAKPSMLAKLEIQQKKAIRHVNNLKYNSHTKEAFKLHGFLQLYDLISYNQAVFIHNYKNNKLPSSFQNMFENVPENVRRMRDNDYNYLLPQNIYSYLNHSPKYQLIYNWNNLHLLLKTVSEPSKFRSELKSHFLKKYKTECTKQNCYSCLAIT